MLHLLPLLSTATSRRSRTAQESARGRICAAKGSVSAGTGQARDEGMLWALSSQPLATSLHQTCPRLGLTQALCPNRVPSSSPARGISRPDPHNQQKSRRAERDVLCSLERSWRQGGAWFPTGKPPRFDASSFRHPRKDALRTSANPRSKDALLQHFSSSHAAPAHPRLGCPHTRARQKQHKRLLSPARPGCLRISQLRAFLAAPSRPRQSGETQALTSELAGSTRKGWPDPPRDESPGL